MRKKFIAGNWKMNGVGDDAVTLAREVRERTAGASGVDTLICPPYTSLQAVGQALTGGAVMLGAQDMFWRDSGAYTGRISGPMLKALGCTHVILGHSECRGRFGKVDDDITDETIRHFGDTDASVALKAQAALGYGLLPILCVGETLVERQAGSTDNVVEIQLRAVFHGLSAVEAARITVAYEPVWAIGTGQTCDAAEANRVCGVIREVVGRVAPGAEANVRVQYGGSVTADNAADLLSRPHVDGALVGGQSLKADAFSRIVAAAADQGGRE